VCVVIVTYNSAADIPELLTSLEAASLPPSSEILVVDNGSTDSTAEIVQVAPGARWLPTGGNLGYSGGINHGRSARAGEGPLVVLNPDLRVRPDAVAHMQVAGTDAAVGVVVPRVLSESGTLFHSLRREPTLLRALGDALFGGRWPGRPTWLSEVVWDDREYEFQHDVDWATGAALLVAPECDAAVGDWDEQRFFLYSEETDYARRARDAGYSVRYVPVAVVVHRGGGSGTSKGLAALMAVNKVRYFSKRHRPLAAFAYRVVMCLDAGLRSSRAEQRFTLRCLLRRASWQTLPGARV
jgi:N-acetylglucosaminyl-diphospho-decaprenol L-rhamnosyltransferase